MYALVSRAQLKCTRRAFAVDVVIETYSFFYGHDDRQIEADSVQKPHHEPQQIKINENLCDTLRI